MALHNNLLPCFHNLKSNDPSMSPTEWAERVAVEFEYNRDDVRKAVKHFVKQMGQ